MFTFNNDREFSESVVPSVGLFLISLPVDICVTNRTYDADQWGYTVPHKDSEPFTSTPPFSGLAVE